MSEERGRTYRCIHAALAAEQERRHNEPQVITPEEYLDLDRRSSQRHEYAEGITLPKEYPPRALARRLPIDRASPAHVRALDFLWQDARLEREINGERWRALLTDARDWDCEIEAVRRAAMDLAGIMAQFEEWERRVRRLWSGSAEGHPVSKPGG